MLSGRFFAKLSALFFLGFLALLLLPSQALASTFTVDSTSDAADAGIDGLCATAGAVCSLRAAIAEANAAAGPHTINFNIPTSDGGYIDFDGGAGNSNGDDYWTFVPATALPTISATGVTINGATQTSNQGDFNTTGPEIEINNNTAGEVNGLSFTGADGTVNSLTINRAGVSFSNINLSTAATGFTLTNSFLGPNAKGTGGFSGSTRANYGITTAADDTTLGTTTSDGNVISGNAQYGVNTDCSTGGTASKIISIAGNKIGLGSDGTTVIANSSRGIYLNAECQATIGGDLATNRNYISGNGGAGLYLNLAANVYSSANIYNNFFGTDTAGTANKANSSQNVFINAPGNDVNIGASGKGNLFRYTSISMRITLPGTIDISYNTFANSATTAIDVTSSTGTYDTNIHHNYFGSFTPDAYFGLTTGANGKDIAISNVSTNSFEVYNNTSNGGTSNFLYLSSLTGAKVYDNTITNNSAATGAIELAFSVISPEIYGNTVTGSVGGVYNASSSSTNAYIHDNTFTNNTTGTPYAIMSNSTAVGAKYLNNIVHSNSATLTDYRYISVSGGTVDSAGVLPNDEGDPDEFSPAHNPQQNFPEILDITYVGSSQYYIAGRVDGKTDEDPFTIEVCLTAGHTSNHGGCLDPLGTTVTASTPDSVRGQSNYYNWSMTVTVPGADGTEGSIFTSLATNVNNETSQFGFNQTSSDTGPGDGDPISNGDGSYAITVDSTTTEDNVSLANYDDGDGSWTGGGTSGLDGSANGVTSIREAIIVANNLDAPVEIIFDIPTTDSGYRDYDDPNTPSSGGGDAGDDYWTIRPTSAFPTITAPGFTIDGSTQTLTNGDKNTFGPEIEFFDSAGLNSINGFRVNGEGFILNDISIHDFPSTFNLGEIRLNGNDFEITNSYIGLDVKGLTSTTNQVGYGIYIVNGSDGVIGNNTDDGNVIGRKSVGIQVDCDNTKTEWDVVVAGNIFGVGADGITNTANQTGFQTVKRCDTLVGGLDPDNGNLFKFNNTGVSLQNSYACMAGDCDDELYHDEVRNNVIDDSVNNGINVGLTEELIIDSNVITDSGTGYGINIVDQYEDCAISNNTINNNADWGIRFQTMYSFCDITDNTISNNGLNGVRIMSQYGPRNELTSFIGNTITDNDDYGVYIQTDNIFTYFEGNTITGNYELNVRVNTDDQLGTVELYNNVIHSPFLDELPEDRVYGDSANFWMDHDSSVPNNWEQPPNDPGDEDFDAIVNQTQNYPVIESVAYLGASMYRVSGDIDGNVDEGPFRIEICESDDNIYTDGACVQSLGSTTANSPWSAIVTIPGSDGTDDRSFSALTTNSLFMTSFFSPNFYATGSNPDYTNETFPVELVYPINEIQIDDPTPLLDWNPSANEEMLNPEVDHYDVYLDGVKIAEVDDLVTGYQIGEAQKFAYNSTHNWQIIAYRTGDVETGRSEVESFTVVPPVYDFELVYPVDVTIDDKTPLFDWSDIEEGSDATFYEIFIDREFVVGAIPVGTSQYQLPANQSLSDGLHVWQVVAYYLDINGEIVEVGRTSEAEFTVEIAVPPVTVVPGEGVIPRPGNGPANPPRPVTPPIPNFFRFDDFVGGPAGVLGGTILAAFFASLLLTLLTFAKELLERLGFLIGGIAPKKKKYWGIVFDTHKSQGLPFAVVRVYDQKKILVSTTVTDLDGRYGIPLETIGIYNVEARANGFKLFNKEVEITDTKSPELILDIPLVRTGERLDIFRALWFYSLPELIKGMRSLILIAMFVGFFYSLYIFVLFPILINLVIVLIYVFLIALNMWMESKNKKNVEGRVIDLANHIGIGAASIILFNQSGDQQDVRLTNNKGVAKIRADEGNYKVQAHKTGYAMNDLAPPKKSIEMKVDKRGYLEKAVFMRKS